MSPEARQAVKLLDKGRALIKSMASECEGLEPDGDHSWLTCPSCLAREESEHRGAREALTAVVAALDDATRRAGQAEAKLQAFDSFDQANQEPVSFAALIDSIDSRRTQEHVEEWAYWFRRKLRELEAERDERIAHLEAQNALLRRSLVEAADRIGYLERELPGGPRR